MKKSTLLKLVFIVAAALSLYDRQRNHRSQQHAHRFVPIYFVRMGNMLFAAMENACVRKI